MKIAGKQVAAARALLGWSQEQLAIAADVVMETVNRWETGAVEPRQKTIERIVRAIEERGVEFTNGGAPGVRFKPKPGVSTEQESAGN
jgi:transcriptional regulator with XRE-family HTH domain